MEKKEIYDMVIQELIEKALSVRRETCSSDEKQFYETLKEKSERTRGVLKQLSEEEYQIVDDYMVTTNLIAQKECEYLYVQGAKDCVELLKKLRDIRYWVRKAIPGSEESKEPPKKQPIKEVLQDKADENN